MKGSTVILRETHGEGKERWPGWTCRGASGPPGARPLAHSRRGLDMAVFGRMLTMLTMLTMLDLVLWSFIWRSRRGPWPSGGS